MGPHDRANNVRCRTFTSQTIFNSVRYYFARSPLAGRAHLPHASRSCSRGRRVEKRALRILFCDPRWVPQPNAAVTLRARFTASGVTRVRGRGERDARGRRPRLSVGPRRRRQDPVASCKAISSPLVRSVPGVHCRARRLGGRRVAERAAARRSRKARPAIGTPARLPRWGPRLWRGDFPPCDPRRVEYHRRISAPGTCRPHASVVAAGAEEYELGAVSRRAERRRPPSLLALQRSVHRPRSDKVLPDRVEPPKIAASSHASKGPKDSSAS